VQISVSEQPDHGPVAGRGLTKVENHWCRSMFSSHFKSFSCVIVVRIEHDIPHLHFYLFSLLSLSACGFFFVFFLCKNLDYVVLNDRGYWCSGKNLEGSSCDLIRVLSQHLCGETEQEPQDSQCLGQDSNWVHPKYETYTSPLWWWQRWQQQW
jgi:hypothetical protein